MGRGNPLDDPELEEIERCLDGHQLDDAERLLAMLSKSPKHEDASVYLETRLLFLRGELDARSVAERLRTLLERVGYFPRAAVMLHEAQTGYLLDGMSRASSSTSERARASEGTFASTSGRPPIPEELRSVTPLQYNSEAPTTRPQPRRKFTPVFGFGIARASKAPDTVPNRPVPSRIPSAPGVPAFGSQSAAFGTDSQTSEPPGAEFDALRAKSLLPPDAGRYSQTPPELERVRSSGPHEKKAGNETASSTYLYEEAPRTARVGPNGPAPTASEIATWIEAGLYSRAIDAIERAPHPNDVEYALLMARALAGAGYTEQAFEAVTRLESTKGSSPQTRAGCARLFVELGEPRRALELAVHALQQDPESAAVRLTFALAAVRCSRRRFDGGLLRQADRVLETLRSRGPMQVLSQALRACAHAGNGDPHKALLLARSALQGDEESADALAAMAEACARAGQQRAAQRAWQHLNRVAPDEAEALAERLSSLGLPQSVAVVAENQSRPPWSSIERALSHGGRLQAIAAIEKLGEDVVRRLESSAPVSIARMADTAADFLTRAPVLRAFGPFDHSFRSVARLEACIDVLYGVGGRPRVTSSPRGLVLLFGAYLGETLKLAYGANWDRETLSEQALVLVDEHELRPFQFTRARIEQGRHVELDTLLQPNGGSFEMGRVVVHTPSSASMSLPWSSGTWPSPNEVGPLGASLCQSVISVFCQQRTEQGLDLSVASLSALDVYVDLISPDDPVGTPENAWLRRTTVLVGGYVGEVMCRALSGRWLASESSATGPSTYRIALEGRSEAMPVEHVHARLLGRTPSGIADYFQTVSQSSERVSSRKSG